MIAIPPPGWIFRLNPLNSYVSQTSRTKLDSRRSQGRQKKGAHEQVIGTIPLNETVTANQNDDICGDVGSIPVKAPVASKNENCKIGSSNFPSL